MISSKDSLNTSESKRTPLEAEILALREEIKQLRAENTAAQAKLKNQEALEKIQRKQKALRGHFQPVNDGQ
jgi:two-component system, OmpR family, sensor histidine kinase VicK